MRRRLHAARGSDDEGAVLLIVLGFLLLFGLFLSALLAQTSSSLATTGVVRDRAIGTYNADAGVDYGLMRVRQDGTLCPNAAAGEQDVTAEIGGPLPVAPGSTGVTVTCRTVDGASVGANGYAAMILSNANDAIETSNGGTKVIDGPVYVEGGMKLQKPLKVNGDVDKKGCATATAPAGLTVTAPGRFACVGSRPALPAHDLPAYPTTSRTKTGATSGACTVFKPGVYTQAPDLKSRNYFTSGVYVFRDIGTWNIKQADVYGGGQASGENLSVTSAAPCTTDAAAGAAGQGTGVEFIFEGNSRIEFDTQSRMELFNRQPTTADGTAGISLYAVGSDAPAGWKPFSGGSLIDVSNGTTPEAAFHGMIYAPNAAVTLFATNSVIAQSQAGLVADKVLIISTPSGDGLAISGTRGKGKRVTVVKATAPSDNGGSATVSQAVAEYPNIDTTTVVVSSRRVLP